MIQPANYFKEFSYCTPIKVKNLQAHFSDQYYDIVMKKNMSSASTIASPLISPRKFPHSDQEIQEETSCVSFKEEGYCSQGKQCLGNHTFYALKRSNSFMLQNYPELIVRQPIRRKLSFMN